MAKLLYNLGSWVYKRPKRVILFWLAIIAVSIGLIVSNGINFKGDMTIPGTKSEKAGQVLQNATGQTKEYGTIRLIFKVGDGKTIKDPSVMKAINKTIDKIQKNDKSVKSILSPYMGRTISKSGKIAYADITYKTEADKVSKESIDNVKTCIEASRNAGVQTELGGSVTLSKTEVGGTSELISIIAAFIVLAFTLGSLRAAGLPIITAIIGLVVGLMGIMVSTAFVDMSALSLSLASMVGLAVGIDYALFIISRYRQNVSEGYDLKEAAALSVGTAGSAVLFAGVTVIIALCGLALVGVPFLGVMGEVAAAMVFVVVMVSLTAVPACLSLAGHHISPKKKKQQNVVSASKEKNKQSNLWGRIVTKYPIITIALVLALTASIGYSAMDLELGLPDNGMMQKESTERKGYDIMSEGFGEGVNGSLVVVMDASKAGNNSFKAMQEAAGKIKGLTDIASITPARPTKDKNIGMVMVTPKTGPNDKETKDLVQAIRDKSADTEKNNKVELMVTGRTAVNIDTADKLGQAIPKFAIVVLGLALVLMILVFRSILVPIKAVVGFAMTLVATLGFDVLTMQKGNFADLLGIPKAGPILCFIPIIVIGILFGLAMDYEVFLVSRIREQYSKTGNAKDAILSGMKSSGLVVAAAGLIMTIVFASFASQTDVNIKSMGIPMAFGVLFDAFVVRMTFVPAIMSLLGKSAWYMPKWLNRILPKFDIEGEALNKERDIA
ncbi:MMPL family transporter [Clostridium felsineum]|uniref:MMPL family transporter n=1 Tax=Clostridium felsineum TaxID=36839 RepID=UPI00214D272B|nr:MMPL family transporter [Clostridium felsineum]MCR3757536.1 MMPL family transporter [Clostridium felsineum]